MMYSRGPEPVAAAVRSYPPNGFGLHDLSGNVWEWCEDWFNAYPGAPTSHPGFGQTYRVSRGGGYADVEESVTTYSRYGTRPSQKTRTENLGFRIVIPAR